MTRAHYEAETLIENRLDAPLKPIVGTNHGRKWPRFKTNDTSSEEHVTIDPIPPPERSGYHIYLVWSAYAKKTEPFAVQALLQIAAYVEANREALPRGHRR